MSLEKAIAHRRSVREFSSTPLAIEQISQLCWAGQGITDRADGFRAAPSAGALFPIELYVVTADRVDHYRPAGHRLKPHLDGDVRRSLQQAALHQEPVGEAPVCLVIAAVVERTAGKYGKRAERYCFTEAGHVAQNILLQATALGLGGVPVGAFEDQKVAKVLKLPKAQRVLYLLPIGHPR
ncbi:MAG: SagB/ThcOx family dehydrogenase [Planctomycetota bacterium]|jgi:SagB-type dehydrogenase family enzyme